MHIQIINFNLKDVSRQDYEGSCSEIAQAFADLPGLRSKHTLTKCRSNIEPKILYGYGEADDFSLPPSIESFCF